MKNEEIAKICSAADMIVCGYAFTKTQDKNIRVLQLARPNHALLMSEKGEILETSMDDVELNIVMGYWQRNKKYMEVTYA